MEKKLFLLIILITQLTFLSCDDPILREEDKIANYLHLAHTRASVNPKMDSLVETLDYSVFDMLWLGGDLAYLTSKDDETMNHVDSVFQLSSFNTLFALGNHDYSNLERVQNFTKRLPFYSANKNGITFLIMDTQADFSNISGKQLALFNTIVDTIQNSSHLILLTHKLIWMYDHPILHNKINSISNGHFGSCSYCVNPNNFYSDIYPKLIEVKSRGIDVLCIAGDIGIKVKEFEYETEEGIFFLASGLNYNESDNKALLFTHNLTTTKLTWEFVFLTQL